MSKSHFLDRYLMSPNHPITIAVIGTGGTGSYVITQLAKICVALFELKGIMLHVTAYDNDIVEKHNVGRQLFSESDIGLFKSNVIISRVNRFYGLQWESIPGRVEDCPKANIIITCVDNLAIREVISSVDTIGQLVKNNLREYERRYYWLDFGNSRNFGQYVLSTIVDIKQPNIKTAANLPDIFKMIPDIKEDPAEPSCSMAESLAQQDLFMNITLAVNGCGLLWKLLRDHQIDYHGQFINLETGNTRPIKIQ